MSYVLGHYLVGVLKVTSGGEFKEMNASAGVNDDAFLVDFILCLEVEV